jgi:hypothetical protein
MPVMPKIFISYRREDSAYPSAVIRNRLSTEFGQNQIFFDVDSIPPGHDFRAYIGRTVGTCDYVLVIIGKHWLTATNPKGGRRLDSPSDFVRLEIRTALNRKIPVIPVLVDNAAMPKAGQLPEDLRELIYRQAILVRPEPDLAHDLDTLASCIKDPTAPPPVARLSSTGKTAHDSRVGKVVEVRDPSQPPSIPSRARSRGGARLPRLKTALLITGLALACPVVLGFLYVLVRAFPSPTVAKSTVRPGREYKNTLNGFAFTIPEGWTEDHSDSSSAVTINRTVSGHKESLNVRTFAMSDEESEAFAANSFASSCEREIRKKLKVRSFEQPEKTSVAGQFAWKFRYVIEVGGVNVRTEQWVVCSKSRGYAISWGGQSKASAADIDELMKSFRFIAVAASANGSQEFKIAHGLV